MSLLPKVVDERFFEYRRRSTSYAGMVGGVVSILLFAYRFYVNHRWSWDLLAVALTFVGIKMGLMAWFYLND